MRFQTPCVIMVKRTGKRHQMISVVVGTPVRALPERMLQKGNRLIKHLGVSGLFNPRAPDGPMQVLSIDMERQGQGF